MLALARIPLLLTMMIQMNERGHQPQPGVPPSRAQFYQEATRFLLSPIHAEHSYDRLRAELLSRPVDQDLFKRL